MSRRTFSAVFLALAATGYAAHALAQTDHSAHTMPVTAKSAAASAAMEEGVVKKIDKAGGKLAIAHAAQPSMPAMTMVYRVKDAASLDKLQPGQKIRFATDPADKGMSILNFEVVK
jgi:Cu/Ag efflux protein CusF